VRIVKEILSASLAFVWMQNVWDCLKILNPWLMIQARAIFVRAMLIVTLMMKNASEARNVASLVPILPRTRLRFGKETSHEEGIEMYDVPNGEDE